MMTTLILFAFIVGLDNFCFGLAFGAVVKQRRTYNILASAFAICEAVMPLLGVLLGASLLQWLLPNAEIVALMTGLLVGFSLLFMGRYIARFRLQSTPFNLKLCLGLPLLLSLDNLGAGMSLVLSGHSLASVFLVVGIISGLMSLLGLHIGHRLGYLAPHSAAQVSGGFLLAMSAYHLLAVG